MTWNYRLVKDKNNIFTIREVYYDKTGNPISMTKDPIIIQAFGDEGENENTVLDILNKVTESIKKYGVLNDPWP